jgi:DNA-binding beta-propeller fold protein YncE
VVIFDWKQRKLLFAWGPGEILGPHDATVLPDGHLLLFDNGLGRGWSRVVELDPITKTVVWEYRDPDPTRFYTLSRGAAQRLRSGNTLVTNSGSGMIFEVTPSGEKVFEYRNTERSDDRRPSVIVRARRLRELGAGPERFEVSD